MSIKQQIDQQIKEEGQKILEKTKVIPTYKDYKPDGVFWVTSKKPLLYNEAIVWLERRVTNAYAFPKSWTGDPIVRLVKSRGIIDYVWTHPDISSGSLFE